MAGQIQYFNMDKSQLSFGSVINIPRLESRPPIRAYCHISGFSEAFGFDKSNKMGGEAARDHLVEIIKDNAFFRKYHWVLAIAWGNKGRKMVDFLGYHSIGENWPGNPDVDAFVTGNGQIVPTPGALNINQVTCGDSIIILGDEEKYRRITSNLAEYAAIPPDIVGLVF